MRELALSRGFYPVVAIPPDDNGGGRSSWKGRGPGADALLAVTTNPGGLEVKRDFASGRMQVMDGEWFTPERGHQGHYVLNLLGQYAEVHVVEEIFGELWNVEIPLEEKVTDTYDEAVLELKDQEIYVSHIVEKAMMDKELLYFELYVDGGNLAMELANRPNVTVATSSLPEWDFGKKEARRTFLALLRSERPHFVWLAPPCTKWSTMQNLAARSPEAKKKLEAGRQREEDNHLEFSADVSDVCDDGDIGFGLEQPHWAASWSTKALNRMNENLVDAICDRCRAGLVYKNPKGKVIGEEDNQSSNWKSPPISSS